MIADPTICLAGDGWGALAAYKSLKGVFKNIDVITSDPNLRSEVLPFHNLISNFQQTNSKLVICAGYKSIVTKQQLSTKEYINIHYSLLPKYRGQHSTVWAILNDERELGLTIHLMNEFIDDGPIIYQHTVLNDYLSTSTFYMEYFNSWIENHLSEIIVNYLNEEIIPIPQNKNLATWVGKRKRIDCKVDFSQNHKYLSLFFRALVPPYPLPYIQLAKDKTEFNINKATIINRKIHTHIGRILNIDHEGIYVSSRDGYVIINQITDMNNIIVDFYNFRIGTFLNQDFE
jgi:methionyl-tRNA formyltransferase